MHSYISNIDFYCTVHFELIVTFVPAFVPFLARKMGGRMIPDPAGVPPDTKTTFPGIRKGFACQLSLSHESSVVEIFIYEEFERIFNRKPVPKNDSSCGNFLRAVFRQKSIFGTGFSQKTIFQNPVRVSWILSL